MYADENEMSETVALVMEGLRGAIQLSKQVNPELSNNEHLEIAISTMHLLPPKYKLFLIQKVADEFFSQIKSDQN